MGRGRRHAASPIASLNAARECAKAASPTKACQAAAVSIGRGPWPKPWEAHLPTLHRCQALPLPGRQSGPPRDQGAPGLPRQNTPEGFRRRHPRTVHVRSPTPPDSRAPCLAARTPPPMQPKAALVAFVRCSTWNGLPWFPVCMDRSVCLRVYPKGHDLSLTGKE